jgi:hypothetical protein
MNSCSKRTHATKVAKSGNDSFDFFEAIKERNQESLPQGAKQHKHVV